MFLQLSKMYDEFRIQSLKVKITPDITQLGAPATWMLHSAFDRNGKFSIPTGIRGEGQEALDTWDEVGDNINSYSSLVSKQIL